MTTAVAHVEFSSASPQIAPSPAGRAGHEEHGRQQAAGGAPPHDGLRLVIEHTVTCVFDVATCDLNVARRGRAPVALARQTAMYLAHVAFSLSFTDVGLLFERDRTTVAHACAVIEDRRDDPVFDRVIELLENAVRALRSPALLRGGCGN